MTVSEDDRPRVGQVYEHIDSGTAYLVVKENPLTLERRVGPFTIGMRRPRPQTLARAYRRIV